MTGWPGHDGTPGIAAIRHRDDAGTATFRRSTRGRQRSIATGKAGSPALQMPGWILRGSERLGWQVLAVQGDHRTVSTVRIFNFFDVQFEVNGADYAVAELLMDQCLEGRTVN